MAVMDSVRQGKGDVIYRQKAISVLGAQCKDKYNKTCGDHCECMEYMALRDMPSAQKKGHWIYDSEAYALGNPYGHYDCDQCGESVPRKTNFCPNCGADMRQEGDANE